MCAGGRSRRSRGGRHGCFAFAALLALAPLLLAQPAAPTKPNILFIAVDDLRPQLGYSRKPDLRSQPLDKCELEMLTIGLDVRLEQMGLNAC
mgnify:CR=1 FL=1